MKVFVINGYPQSGKSTFVEYVRKYAPVVEYSTVGFIKDFLTSLGWNGEKDPKSRKCLSDIKDALTEWRDMSVVMLGKTVMMYAANNVKMNIFVMSREPAEIERIAKEYRAIKVFVDRGTKPTDFSNHADKDVEKVQYDITISNTGTLEDLEQTAETFARNFCEL